MAVNVKNSKYFYPPRPGSGAGTFSDNIVGLQTVEGGGLTQGNFEFTTSVTEKVNRTFNVGAFSEPISLEGLDINDLTESRRIMATQFRVYPNYDVSQVLNFSMYGSLSKRFQVSITEIIHRFPASLDILFNNEDFVTGATATNISYDSTLNETSISYPNKSNALKEYNARIAKKLKKGYYLSKEIKREKVISSNKNINKELNIQIISPYIYDLLKFTSMMTQKGDEYYKENKNTAIFTQIMH